MKVLLVGAGAVGQVYGHFLHAGGAEVAFLIKPAYAAAARAGFVLYPRTRGKPMTPVRFDDFEVLTGLEAVEAERWDAVVLCVSSTALRHGTWLADLAAAVGDATVVTLQPGLDDYELIRQHLPAERIVSGLIALASYSAPLPGEEVPEPGTAFWVPPFARFPFSGPRAPAIVAAFRAGGLPARVHADVQTAAAFGVPLLQSQICALELAGWSFADVRADKRLRRAAFEVMREATAVAAAERGVKAPLLQRLLRPSHVSLIMRLAARLAPMDLERFFQFHYTKVRDQSRDLLDTWIDRAERRGLDNAALTEMRARLGSIAEMTAPAAISVPSSARG